MCEGIPRLPHIFSWYDAKLNVEIMLSVSYILPSQVLCSHNVGSVRFGYIYMQDSVMVAP